ncbi:MAG: flagellar motor stator protein MotA, partial [Bacteroidota bacterium]|nr:flagellar motor stator protein MotA [Bacteroidota bacterium]
MFVIIGAVIVFVGVLAGFTLAGGNPLSLLQYSEFVTIGSAAIGSLLISAPLPLIKKIIKSVTGVFKPHDFAKQDYLEILKSLNDLFLVAQRDGLLAIEKHIETPEQSDILGRNKKFISNEFYRSFFADTMKVMLSGGVPPHELEGLIEAEIETYEDENKPVTASISRMGDSLPGLGIVAAVLGIIVTMGSISAGAEKVGEHVASALVGTFLGILLAYGFINPLAAIVEHGIETQARFLGTLKACIIAYAKGNPPIIAVEIARRTIYSDSRPSFSELESYIR